MPSHVHYSGRSHMQHCFKVVQAWRCQDLVLYRRWRTMEDRKVALLPAQTSGRMSSLLSKSPSMAVPGSGVVQTLADNGRSKSGFVTSADKWEDVEPFVKVSKHGGARIWCCTDAGGQWKIEKWLCYQRRQVGGCRAFCQSLQGWLQPRRLHQGPNARLW